MIRLGCFSFLFEVIAVEARSRTSRVVPKAFEVSEKCVQMGDLRRDLLKILKTSDELSRPRQNLGSKLSPFALISAENLLESLNLGRTIFWKICQNQRFLSKFVDFCFFLSIFIILSSNFFSFSIIFDQSFVFFSLVALNLSFKFPSEVIFHGIFTNFFQVLSSRTRAN